MPATHYCEKCGKVMNINQFYKSKNVDKYPPDGRMNICKSCLTLHVDNWDPDTFKWILKEIDVPYVKDEWDKILNKYLDDPSKLTGVTILGRYLSTMKLKQWNKFNYEDSEKLETEILENKIIQMKTQGMTDEEIRDALTKDRIPPKPSAIPVEGAEKPGQPQSFSLVDEEEEEKIANQLTDEDKMRLRIKWGSSYRPSELVRMEQLYDDMMRSYDIQGAGHKDTLIMICKTSLKANQLIDAGDIDSFQKMSRAYDTLMKSGKFDLDCEKPFLLPQGLRACKVVLLYSRG